MSSSPSRSSSSIEANGSVKLFRRTGKPVTGNRESAHKKDEMNREDPMQSNPEWLQPFKDNLEDLETHVPAHSSERENSDSEGAAKVVT